MRPELIRPSAIPRIPMDYKATVHTHDGWWFRYVVHRTHGVFNLENGVSFHRTLKGARRAAKRWSAQTNPELVVQDPEAPGVLSIARAL